MTHVRHNSGNFEWYTPSYIIESARKVMGSIDLDPASCVYANKNFVKAKAFYTFEDDGLYLDWFGNIWLNPPYGRSIVDMWVNRAKEQLPNIDRAIFLVNNATETKWFNTLASFCDIVCFTRSRIKYISPTGVKNTPLQGQAILSYNNDTDKFINEFNSIGNCFKICKK